MIKKASEILELFIQNESEKLNLFSMPHMPTLGTAYEDITKQGIDNAFTIPQHLSLSVVSGFISIDGEMQSAQIDCMLVVGDGVKYGLTEQFIYPIEQILCIFEVKKTLNKKDLIDAFDHLGRLQRKISKYIHQKLEQNELSFDVHLIRETFSKITGREAPQKYENMWSHIIEDQLLFFSLIQEFMSLVTIIHGYGGYKTEQGIRSAFADIIESKWKSKDMAGGIPSIPSLVTANQFSLVKSNGRPYITLNNATDWCAVSSTRHNTARMILELIWSKISFYFNIKMPWNDELDMENLKPLLTAQAMKHNSDVGWYYKIIDITEKNLLREDDQKWEPKPFGKVEIAVAQLIGATGGYLLLDDEFNNYLNETYSSSNEEIEKALIESRLFMKDKDYITPINSVTHILSNADGSGFIAADRELFDLWCIANNRNPEYLNIIIIG